VIAPEVTYRLDSNHVGIRLVVVLVLFVLSMLGAFVIMPAIFKAFNANTPPMFCISGVAGLALGLGGAWGVEYGLRKIWPSGRWVKVNDRGLVLGDRRGDETQVSWSERVDVLSWHFLISQRRSPVPKGWYCLACQLREDEQTIALYAFLKPSVAEALPQLSAFEALHPLPPPRQGQDPRDIVDEQKELRAAEMNRWDDGGEMEPDDFVALVEALDARLAQWPAKGRA
jgi:hypothetical protein